MIFTANAIGHTPPLPLPKDLVGEWVLFDARRFCRIHLWLEEMAPASGLKLTVDAQPGACNFPMPAVAWRPASDGIALLDQDGNTLVFLSQDAGGYRSDISSDQGMRLERKKAVE